MSNYKFETLQLHVGQENPDIKTPRLIQFNYSSADFAA